MTFKVVRFFAIFDVILCICSACNNIYFLLSWDKSHVKWDNSRNSTQKMRTKEACIECPTFLAKLLLRVLVLIRDWGIKHGAYRSQNSFTIVWLWKFYNLSRKMSVPHYVKHSVWKKIQKMHSETIARTMIYNKNK